MNKYQALISELKHCYHIDEKEPVIVGLQELVDRATPMKPTKYEDCPTCNTDDCVIELYDEFSGTHYEHAKYCPNCGQALDWSDNE